MIISISNPLHLRVLGFYASFPTISSSTQAVIVTDVVAILISFSRIERNWHHLQEQFPARSWSCYRCVTVCYLTRPSTHFDPTSIRPWISYQCQYLYLTLVPPRPQPHQCRHATQLCLTTTSKLPKACRIGLPLLQPIYGTSYRRRRIPFHTWIYAFPPDGVT